MKAKLTWIAALVLALGLIASGCGGDDDDTESTDTVAAETLSKAEFVEQGNEICKQGNKDFEQAAESAQGASKEETDALVQDELVPIIQGQIDDLRALGIPEADQDEVNQMLDDAQSDLDKLSEDPSLISDQSLFADVNPRLSEYGLTACAG